MVVKNSRYQGIFVSALVVLLFVALISSCNDFNLPDFVGGDASSGPIDTGILAPTNNARVLVDSPVQILSAPDNENTEQVELRVEAADEETEQLISRVNLSSSGTGIQVWTPNRAGVFTLMVVAYDADGNVIETLPPIQVEAIDNVAVSIVPEAVEPAPSQPVDEGAGFQSPTVTPTTVIQPEPTEVAATAEPVEPAAIQPDTMAASVLEIQETESLVPTQALTPTFPPPPPIPGVPYGPTQDKLPKLIPPVCDAAEFIDVFRGDATDPSQRDFIREADQELAVVAAGTTVHRAWKMRNIGTCTWGPGYELAFYGGRAMGSGGVAFESTFPSDPPRRNRVSDVNRLIVPEGKPNQIAVLEVLLNTPTFPGIHQSYWRMRNPQGVFFGPIIGVTMKVVRDCNESAQGGRRIYGAPGVRIFRILGVNGNLAGTPGEAGQGPFLATVGQLITLDWSVVNATSFEVVIRNPLGEVESISSGDPIGRANFTPTIVGEYTLTLVAENGVCLNDDNVIRINVRPPTGEQFIFRASFATNAPINTDDVEASFSSAVAPGTVEVSWNHFDNEVDQIILHADLYRRRLIRGSCILEDLLGDLLCTRDRYEEFQLDTERQAGTVGTAANATATLCRESPECGRLRLEIESDVQAAGATITAAQHANLIYCRPSDSSTIEYGVNYYVEALKDGAPADPQYSSPVFVTCNGASAAGRPGIDD